MFGAIEHVVANRWGPMLLLFFLLGCRETMLSPAEIPERDANKEWARVLAKVVTDDGMVDYDALEANRGALDRFVANLSDDGAKKGKKTADHHAFYLNAYNALVMFQVLERGRPASVLDPRGMIPISGHLFFRGTQFKVDRDYLSLSEIENERLRWLELDLRDHAAMNCASRSCPPLRNELYRTADLQEQLQDQMERWVSDDERGLRIEDGSLVMSPIFEWFERDFAFFSNEENLCVVLAEFADGDKRAALEALAKEGCPRRTFEYDWRLNDVSRR